MKVWIERKKEDGQQHTAGRSYRMQKAGALG